MPISKFEKNKRAQWTDDLCLNVISRDSLTMLYQSWFWEETEGPHKWGNRGKFNEMTIYKRAGELREIHRG